MSFWTRSDITIYILIDPRDELVRYVGGAGDPEDRLDQHLSQRDKNKGKRLWIDGLAQDGLEPRMEVIETVSADIAANREQRWIAYFLLCLDMPLLNKTPISRRNLRWAKQELREKLEAQTKDKAVA